MKKIFSLLVLLISLSSNSLFGQTSNKLATYSNGFSWTKSTNQIENAMNNYFRDSLNGDFEFSTVLIDDPSPANLDSVAYLIITAVGTRENGCITFGLALEKSISPGIVGAIDFSIRDIEALRVASGLEEIGWKCTSTSTECGGCVKIRQNGVVVACHCYATPTTYCNFETTGGGGANLPPWLIQLVIALIGLF